MVLRTGKYKGYTVEEISYIDPGYLRWIRENRPEMLIQRVTKKKVQVTPVEEDQEVEKKVYKNIPLGSWNSSF